MRPASVHVMSEGSATHIRFDDGRTLLQASAQPARVVVGARSIARQTFRHGPPKPAELEQAFDRVEDARMAIGLHQAERGHLVSGDAAPMAPLGHQGSAKWYYRFAPDGRYTFTHEFWSLGRNNEFWTVEESGRYRQSAETIEVTPTQVRRLLRDHEGRPQGEPQALPPEPARYRYAFQYLSGMQRWYLVLMPESGRDTHRDGTRSALPDFGQAYRYGRRPYCVQRPRPSDCKG